MFKTIIFYLVVGFFLQTNNAKSQQEFLVDRKKLIDDALISNIRAWMENPILSVTLKAQNQHHANLTEASIKKLDDQWRKEREADDQPLISATLSSPLSIFLLRVQSESQGLYSEIIVTDSQGLNAGQSVTTTDYWQGDEDKFKKTFNVGPDAVFIDEPEFNEATKTWRSQVNMTVTDAQTSQKLGSITVEINLTELKRRAAF